MTTPFHLAIPVSNLDATREFYGSVLEFEEGRSCDKWIDWDFFGHQVSTHLVLGYEPHNASNEVDGKRVPTLHFGAVLPWNVWHQFSDKLKSKNIEFIIEPYIRFRGKTGEQATMFFLDPSKNALEFKSFRDQKGLFEK